MPSQIKWTVATPAQGRSFGRNPILPTDTRNAVTKYSTIDGCYYRSRVEGHARYVAASESLAEHPATGNGPFFNGKGEGYSVDAVVCASIDDGLQHILILNPHDGAMLDMQAYIRDVMAEVQSELGHPVNWVAVIHKSDTVSNPDNQHAHIVIRGVKADGELLTFPAEFVERGFCYIAQRVATRYLGTMTQAEVTRMNANRRKHTCRTETLNRMDRQGASVSDKKAYTRSYVAA